MTMLMIDNDDDGAHADDNDIYDDDNEDIDEVMMMTKIWSNEVPTCCFLVAPNVDDHDNHDADADADADDEEVDQIKCLPPTCCFLLAPNVDLTLSN